MSNRLNRPTQRILFRAVCSFLFFLWASSSRAQVTINVPAEQSTIQAGINAANNGDTVLVAPGTYTENINFGGKSILVTSSGGASATIIDGGAQGAVVTFNHNETTNAQLSGFTIRNGLQDGQEGGGILIANGSPTITANVITGNHAAFGIGIAIEGGSPIIKNNTITGNNQTGAGDGGLGGGGIVVSGSGTTGNSIQIVGNTISNNSVASGGEGGGLTVVASGSVIVQGNLISGNTAFNDGGGMYVGSFSTPFVVQNIIVNNASLGGGHGGGLRVSSASGNATSFYFNNTIAANSAFDNASGIYINGFPQTVNFTNNIIVAASGQNAVTCDSTFSTVSPAFSFNDAFSVSGQPWAGICDSTSNPGNVSVDPLFVSPTTDFHLQSTSPVIDAGSNSAQNLPTTDFDGKPRILDGNNDCVSTIDLGAYEFQSNIAAMISPASLLFPSQLVGTTSSPQSATLSSVGATCFQFASIQTTGDFSQMNSCPAPGVPGGSSCTINIAFDPTAVGPRVGSFTATSTTGASVSVSLSGTGFSPAPVVSLSPGSLVFPGQIVGTFSAAQTVTLSNTGNAPLSITSIATTGDFTQSNGCSISLAAGASCAIQVIFAPSASGNRTASVLITDNAAGGSQSVTSSGTGIDFAIAPTVGAKSVARGHSVKFTIDVTSIGGIFGNAVTLSCSGLPSRSECEFYPAAVTPGSTGVSSVMTVETENSTPLGTFTLAVTGKSGALLRTTQVQLTVTKH